MNIESLHRLFRSKRFWSYIAGIIAMLLVNFIPALDGQEEQLTDAIRNLTLMLIGTYGVQDTATAWKASTVNPLANTPNV